MNINALRDIFYLVMFVIGTAYVVVYSYEAGRKMSIYGRPRKKELAGEIKINWIVSWIIANATIYVAVYSYEAGRGMSIYGQLRAKEFAIEIKTNWIVGLIIAYATSLILSICVGIYFKIKMEGSIMYGILIGVPIYTILLLVQTISLDLGIHREKLKNKMGLTNIIILLILVIAPSILLIILQLR